MVRFPGPIECVSGGELAEANRVDPVGISTQAVVWMSLGSMMPSGFGTPAFPDVVFRAGKFFEPEAQLFGELVLCFRYSNLAE